MYKTLFHLLLGLSLLLSTESFAGRKKPIRVRLTGTVKEEATLKMPSGTTMQIKSLPFEFYVNPFELPLTLQIESPNYEYKEITVNRQEEDLIGWVYVVHSEKKQAAAPAVAIAAPAPQPVEQPAPQPDDTPHLDPKIDVNRIPETGFKATNTFALIIANENYEMVSKVDMASYDGLAFKEYCARTLGLGPHNIKYYPDATYGKMSKALREIREIAQAFDGRINLIFYYAGHGIPDNATKDAYILPTDADGQDTGVCFSLKEIYKEIEQMQIAQTVVFLDACFSGAERGGEMIVAARGVALTPNEEEPKGSMVVFSASSNEEAAYAYKEKQHGLFSYFLLKKLQESKGEVSLGELADYLWTNVRQQSITINGKKQTPSIVPSPAVQEHWRSMYLNRQRPE